MSRPADSQRFTVEQATPQVIVAALREWFPDLSWSKIRGLLESRRVAVGGALCLYDNRRLHAGEWVDVFAHSLPLPPQAKDVTVRFCDRHLVIVEKPPRMTTLRHKAERSWPASRKCLQPTLEEALQEVLGDVPSRSHKSTLLSVHRIDRDTSGLVAFARHLPAQERLIAQFASHDVQRVYRAVVPGDVGQQTIRWRLVRNRGDGLRGSRRDEGPGRHAVTHIRPISRLRSESDLAIYSEIECRLETGRTHQIRIHMAELGHPLCGDVRYRGPFDSPPIPDPSGAPRLALHAAELGVNHPISGKLIHFTSPWPPDMVRFLGRLQA